MRKGDERKAALLKASEELFFTKGYAATSINDILDTQGISKGSFYHHFESKLEVLQALCAAHAQASFERYREQVSEDTQPLDALNCLLYNALPISPEEEHLCALLLQLHRSPEGEQVISATLEARKKLFFGPFSAVLNELKASGDAFLPLSSLPVLAWDAHMALFRHLMDLGLDYAGKSDPLPPAYNDETDALRAARYLLERTLDLPFGSIVIIRAEVLNRTLRAAADTARVAMTSLRPVDARQISMFQD